MALLGSGDAPKKARLSWAGRSQRAIVARAKALTAAAASSETDTGKKLLDLHQPWQAKAFATYNKMGECWNPVQFVARAMSKVRLYAATGTVEDPEELDSGWAFDLVQKWQRLPEPYGRLRTLIGEGRLCQFRDPLDDSQVVWEFLSPVELKKDPQGKIVRLWGKETIEYRDISQTNGRGDPEPGEIRMWRFWRPHPENSGYADSSFRGVLDLYDQLWWLTLSERAELRNRVINAGLLLVPEEIEFEPDGAEDQATEGEDPEVDPFTELIMEVMTVALQNPGSAEAAAPPVIRAESELLHPDKFRLLKFHDPASSLFMTGREDALLRRISIGLDLPVEAFMGMGTLNHWNAWKLDDEKYQHIEPTISSLAWDLTQAVLRPIGRASNQRDADEVFIAVDVSKLVSDPDRGKTALELYGERLISGKSARDANAFGDADEMTDEAEIEAWRLDHGVAGQPQPDPATNEEPPPEDGTDGESTNGSSPDGEAARAVVAARFTEAANQAARASAAAWVRSKRRTDPDAVSEVGSVRAQEFIEKLGPDRLERLGITRAQLADRMTNAFFQALDLMSCRFPQELAHKVAEFYTLTMFDTDAAWPDELCLLEVQWDSQPT